MRCPACGKQLPPDPYFCAYCGAVVRARPAPLPRLGLDLGTVPLALGGAAAALPVSVGFWLLAGQLAGLSWDQRLTLGGLVAGLSGLAGAALRRQLGWPLAGTPPRWSPRQVSVVYGLGGGLSIALGALLVGAVVLPVAWGLAAPTLPALLAGASTGLVAVIFALPPALLVGYAAGYALGGLTSAGPAPLAAWGAALAWWLAGCTGGGVAGGFVAAQSSLALPTGIYLGALVQGGLQVVLLPLVIYLVHWYLVLTS